MIRIGGFRVLVKPVELDEVDDAFAAAKRAGLEIIRAEKEREQNAVEQGKIVQIGSTAYGEFDGDQWFFEGDNVIYARYSGKKVKDPESNDTYLILNAEDILCVLGE